VSAPVTCGTATGGSTFVFVRLIVKLSTNWNDTTSTHVAGAPCSTEPLTDLIHEGHHKLIVELAGHHRLPAVSWNPNFPKDGGLMSYSVTVSTLDQFRRAAGYVDRILKGEKPADLPVEQPTRFLFVLNLKTAKAMGLNVPNTLLALADEVVE
jgi:ABC-type uncharacterized transport system substrate-binding protein